MNFFNIEVCVCAGSDESQYSGCSISTGVDLSRFGMIVFMLRLCSIQQTH